MSLENALETAKQLLEDQGEGMPCLLGTSVEKKKKAGGDAETADGKGAESLMVFQCCQATEKGQLVKHTPPTCPIWIAKKSTKEEEMAGKSN